MLEHELMQSLQEKPYEELEGEYKSVAETQRECEEALLALPNVVGVGVGHEVKESEGGKETGNVCLSVFVSQKVDPSLLRPGENVKDVKVGKHKADVVEVGTLFAGCGEPALAELPGEVDMEPRTEAGIQTLRKRLRPVEGGYSIGHYRITAGTYATAVVDTRSIPGIPPKYYALSNNHVLANSNDAKPGDPILQPGRYDGGTYPADVIARLSRFVPIRFGGPINLVDAAIAEGEFHDLDREIYWIGYVKGVAGVRVGQVVEKTGRTTNYTTGVVRSVNATVNVNYGGGRVARFAHQILTTNMSAGGDSGSLLCDLNERAVGLLFAGSNVVTIFNPIRYVQALLGIRVV